tara:strand:+ start:40 stop:576 length:537 start_codon:yes stop_codon:yes gene_type:complete
MRSYFFRFSTYLTFLRYNIVQIILVSMVDSTAVNESLMKFHWKCQKTWKKSAKNTLWCLLGCSIGDFGTILFFQIFQIMWSTLLIMIIAIINGLITSVILETIVLYRQMKLKQAFQTAIGMSFISMISMEVAMNAVDWILIGEARLTWWIIPLMLLVGFLTPWPYNYWRLKKYNIECH